VGSSPPFDSSLAEREIEHIGTASKQVAWNAPNGSTYTLTVPPTVYPPREDTSLLAKVLSRGVLSSGLQFFEIGCGSGALSLLAASYGCVVRACDVNPLAVACTRALLKNEKFGGQVFEGGPGPSADGAPAQWGGDHRYDVVVWNLPYLPLPQEGPYLGPMEEAALVDTDPSGLYERFLNMLAAGSLLHKSGHAYILLSSKKDGQYAREKAWSKGLAVRIVEATTLGDGEELYVLQIWHPFANTSVLRHEEISSTNEVLLSSDEPVGTSVIAQRQTQGRGRRGRSWATHSGALLTSWVVANAAALQHHPSDQVRTGSDIVRLLKYLVQAASASKICLKWPNDVYLWTETSGSWRKAGGVLFEGRSQGSKSRLVLGVGLNIDKPNVREHAGLLEAGCQLTSDALHSMLHALVASRFEHRGLHWLKEVDHTSVEAEVLDGIDCLKPIFYREKELKVEHVDWNGALVTSDSQVIDEPEDIRWSNI
jgi:biotin-[acetyl-CoA-carboxylase] ligase BirA-like protein